MIAFAIAGVLAGISGALVTLDLGVISPAMFGVVPSIEMVIWVAIGGRNSLLGAIIGTLAVNFGKDIISSAFPDLWLYVVGAIFVLVVTVMPQGLVGGGASVRASPAAHAGIAGSRGRARMSEGASSPLLAVEHVTVSFDGFKALNDLSFSLDAGKCHVLVGPNGAGKSTLLDTIIGRVRPTSGPRDVQRRRYLARPRLRDRAARAICRKFQTPGVLDALTIEDNLRVAVTRTRGALYALTAKTTPAERERIHEVLGIIGLADRRNDLAAELAHGNKQWLEIGWSSHRTPSCCCSTSPPPA